MLSDDDRLEQILDDLEEIFLKEGFRKVTIGELASRLRCSRRTFYEIASSKEELFLRVLDRLLTRVRQLGEEAAAGQEEPELRLEAFLTPGFTETLNGSDRFFADIDSNRKAKRLLEEHQRDRADELGRIIRDGVRKGKLRRINAEFVIEVSRAVARRIKDPEFLARTNMSVSDAFRQWTQLFLHGIHKSD